MDFDDGGFGGAEDNLSMPLGDFMAFLESEPADDGEDPQPEVRASVPFAAPALP